MTSRLKRKLGDLGVDTSSKRATENFCLIGTPLPPLEKSRDTGEFVPLWKQDVRDEKGRRRLHGAFTGGFSAGYFNTVGSKEGWAPSTFVSSRSDRAKKKAARPEDFMDEEDLQEIRDSQKLVDTTETMDFSGTRAANTDGGPEDDSITGMLKASLLPAPSDSAGARILKKMGWKLGQGIGPRVTWKQRKQQDLEAQHGRGLVPDNVKIPDDDDEAKKHMYPPRDIPVMIVPRKDNHHGLGYKPGMSLNESLSGSQAGSSSGPKLAGGFGLGALNDADEDDLDVYDSGPSATRNRTAYDTIARDEDEHISVGPRSARMTSGSRPTASVQTFQDGQPVLPGFVLSDRPVAEDRWFPLPEPPSGWRPDPRRVWNSDKENIQAQEPPEPSGHGRWKNNVSADTRGSMLGEKPLAKGSRSVFEYMSQKDAERLKNTSAKFQAGSLDSTGPVPSPPPPPPAATSIVIRRIDPHVAQAALRGFQPFTADPAKQARYKLYLQSQTSEDASQSPPVPLPNQKIDEFNKELEDYATAAQIFKPMSGAMASRFTSAAIIDHGPKVHEGLHTPSQEAEEKARKAEEVKRAEEKVSPKVHAAKMGMFGPLTRESTPWQPARLLCKRFGVKDPNPPPDMPPPDSMPASEAAAASAEQAASASGSGIQRELESAGSGPRDLRNIGLGEDESQGRDILTYTKPSMDVFKAIFASDEEDSDDEDADKPDAPLKEAVPPTAVPAADTSVDKLDPPSIDALPRPSEPTSVDLGTFKPMFIPREGKGKKTESGKDRDKEKGGKKRKKEKKTGLVSFAMEEDGGDEASELRAPKERPKKKKRKEKKDDEEEDMWVEKPPPEVVKEMVIDKPALPLADTPDLGERDVNGPPRGRKRAIDFL
ncbi:hypothetical protein HGRIS_005091 [Hohenbuehelia grisea]|uniref:G-patch domain-containing protein n=1 Tax=Hohenbuehelia grisea TaxID=104357 RepID=A0ABR3JDY2_9AGAR